MPVVGKQVNNYDDDVNCLGILKLCILGCLKIDGI